MNTRQLLSVGIDIGTTTTQVIFSRLELVNRAAVSQVPRYEFIKREISWQSPVFFTPVDKQGGLKEAELKTSIAGECSRLCLRFGFSRGRVFFWHQHHRHANRRYAADQLADNHREDHGVHVGSREA